MAGFLDLIVIGLVGYVIFSFIFEVIGGVILQLEAYKAQQQQNETE